MKNKEKKEIKERKSRANRGQFAVRVIASILALFMLLSVCGTVIYYLYTAIK